MKRKGLEPIEGSSEVAAKKVKGHNSEKKGRTSDDGVVVSSKKFDSHIQESVLACLKLIGDTGAELDGLHKFVKNVDGTEFIACYLSSSPECKELFYLFESSGWPSSDKLSLIWEAFEAVLVATSNKAEKTSSSGSFIVSKLLQNHLKLLYSSLSTNASTGLSKSALKCMTVMLAQGIHTVQEFLATFDFTHKGFRYLARKRDRKQRPDLRTCFVRFCVAFFIFGDCKTTRILLEEKHGFSALLLQDLHLDSEDTISLVLNILLTKVVQETSLLKKVKLLFLNAASLSKLAILLKHKDSSIQDITREILQTTCTDPKLGICFANQSEALSTKSNNPVLLRFFLLLKQQVVENEILSSILIDSMRLCPDLIIPFVDGLKFQMDPKNSDLWMRHCQFFIKLWESLPRISSIVGNYDVQQQVKFFDNIDVVGKLVVPSAISKGQMALGMKGNCKNVQKLVLKLLLTALGRCTDALSCASSGNHGVDRLQVQFLKLLPDVKAVIAVRQTALCDDLPLQEDHAVGSDELKGALVTADHHETLDADMLFVCTEVLLLYQTLKPGIISATNFNICKLLMPCKFKQGSNEYAFWCGNLNILLLEPDSTANWISRKLQGNVTLFDLVLQRFVKAVHLSEEYQLCRSLFCKVMTSCQMFKDSQFDLHIWMHNLHLACAKHSVHSSFLLRYVAASFARALLDPYAHMDYILSLAFSGLEGKVPQGNSVDRSSLFKCVSLVMFLLRSRMFEKATPQQTEVILCYILRCVQELCVLQADPMLLISLVDNLLLGSAHATNASPAVARFLSFAKSYLKLLGLDNKLSLVNKVGACQEMEDTDDADLRDPECFACCLCLCLPRVADAESRAQAVESDICAAVVPQRDNLVKLLQQCDRPGVATCVLSLLNVVKIGYFGARDASVKHRLADREAELFDFCVEWLRSAIARLRASPARCQLRAIPECVVSLPWVYSLLTQDKDRWETFAYGLISLLAEELPELACSVIDLAVDHLLRVISKKGASLKKNAQARVSLLLRLVPHLESSEKQGHALDSLISFVLHAPADNVDERFRYLPSLLALVSRENSLPVLPDTLASLLKAISDRKSAALGEVFCKLLPMSTGNVHLSLKKLYRLLNSRSDVVVSVAVQVFKQDRKLRENFSEELKGNVLSGEVLGGPYLPAVWALLESNSEEDARVICKTLCSSLWGVIVAKLQILSDGGSDPYTEGTYALKVQAALAEHATLSQAKEAVKVLNGISKNVEHFPRDLVTDVLQVTEVILSKMAELPRFCKYWATSLTVALDGWKSLLQTTVGNDGNDVEVAVLAHVGRLLDVGDTATLKLCFKDLESIALLWMDMLKLVLKKRFVQPSAMALVARLVPCLYSHKKFQEKARMKPAMLFQLVVSHSKFLEILFDPADGTDLTKEAILSLVVATCRLGSDCFVESLVPIFLGAYGGTLRKSDRYILEVLQKAETYGVSLRRFQPLLWGTTAVETYRSSAASGLLARHSCRSVLDLIDAKKMLQSVVEFPVHQDLTVSQETVTEGSRGNYDPSFFLSLFANMMCNGQDFDCRTFVDHGCLSFAVAALSSYVPVVRQLAYLIISSYNEHLESSRFREKNQVSYLLLVLKNSLTEPNQRVPCIWTVYISRCLYYFLRPEQHLYSILNSQMLQKPVFLFKEMPVFLALFNSSSMEFSKERSWLLRLLLEGLRDPSDYYLYKRHHVLELLMAFFDSALCDSPCKSSILAILNSAARIHQAAYDLVKNYGFIAWMHSRVKSSTSSAKERSTIVSILQTLVETFERGFERKGDTATGLGDDAPLEKEACEQAPVSTDPVVVASDGVNVPRLFPNESLLLCAALVEHSRSMQEDDLNRIRTVVAWFVRHHRTTQFGDLLSSSNDRAMKDLMTFSRVS